MEELKYIVSSVDADIRVIREIVERSAWPPRQAFPVDAEIDHADGGRAARWGGGCPVPYGRKGNPIVDLLVAGLTRL